MKIYRMSIPASLVFDVKAKDDAHARRVAKMLATQPLDLMEGKDMKEWPGGRLYLWPTGNKSVDIEDSEELP